MNERYMIYDANQGLFDDDTIIFAKNATEAVKKYMQEKGITGQIKRSGDRDVRFKATKTRVIDGKIYRSGRDVWYQFTA